MADAGRFRLKQTPTDVWSTRERLALASSVSRSGDQNWVSVSRAVRPFGMPNRPSDWFSQKNCALQYSELLENVETPRRKRNEREAVETPGDVIVRKLTIERIEELKKEIAKEAEEYRALKKDLEAVRSGLYDNNIKVVWEKLQVEKAAAEAAAAKAAAEETAARERAKAAAMKSKKFLPQSFKSIPSSDLEDNTQDSSAFDPFNNEDSNISLVSSIPTPGPSQIIETSLSVTSPLTGTFLPQSPKAEFIPSDPASAAKDVDSADVIEKTEPDEMSAEEKIEITQEEFVVGDLVKSEMTVESETVVKTEEQVVEEDVAVSPCMVSCSAIDEVEIKTETPVPEQQIPSCEDDVAEDDELIPFTPAEVASPPVSIEPVAEEPAEVKSAAPDDAKLDAEEEVSEETVEESVEEMEEKQAEDVEEESKEQEMEANEEKNEESQEEIIKKPEEPVTNEEPEAPKSEETLVLALAPVAEPTSPTSSIVSTEIASVQDKKPIKRRRGRRPKRTGRPPNKIQPHSVEGKDSELSSKEGETSDEEGSRVHLLDNEDSMLHASFPQHLDPNESVPNSPASLSHSDTEDEKSHRVWKKSIMLVWRAATNHKCASVFLHPVTEDIAPGYHSIVHKAMDLQKIKRKIDNGEIRTTAEFQRDMMLMFTNAIMYNNSDHDVHKMAKNMYKDVMGHIEQFVSTQIMVQSEPKLLRTLRRTDPTIVHSDKEEDTKKKKVPTATLR